MTLVAKAFHKILTLGLLASCFLSCDKKSEPLFFFSGNTMGTTYSIKLAESEVKKASLEKDIKGILKKVNKLMSTYQEDSQISLLNQSKAGQKQKIDPWFYKVLDYSLDLAKKTEGYYDPTVGPLVNLWGFGPGRPKSQKLPQQEEIQKIQEHVGFDLIQLSQEEEGSYAAKLKDSVYVDLSSSAKGFAVDKLAEHLKRMGYRNFLVEVGGEIKAEGSKHSQPWKVAIEKPLKKQRALSQVIALKGQSIATSGNYRNFFSKGSKSYSHTLDPKTGRPVENRMLSASVLNESCMKADALATAFMVMGVERAKAFAQKFGISAFFIYKAKDKAAMETYSTESFELKTK